MVFSPPDWAAKLIQKSTTTCRLPQDCISDGSTIGTVYGSEIPNNHLGCMKPCKSWDKLPINWCTISSINSISFWSFNNSYLTMFTYHLDQPLMDQILHLKLMVFDLNTRFLTHQQLFFQRKSTVPLTITPTKVLQVPTITTWQASFGPSAGVVPHLKPKG